MRVWSSATLNEQWNHNQVMSQDNHSNLGNTSLDQTNKCCKCTAWN